jgi:SAM-dependent methyltransferase
MPCDDHGHLDAYRTALAKFGASFETTLWQSREAQQKRFDVMIDMVNFESMTVLDAGCGLADFAARLIQRGVNFRQYIGIDALQEMIDACQSRRLPRCTFRQADFATELASFAELKSDYTVFSGSLNTMTEDHARRVVAEAFKHSGRGVVFNFLSDHPHPKWKSNDLGPATRFNTVEWIRWALEKTSQVAFDQRYLEGHDATVVIERVES